MSNRPDRIPYEDVARIVREWPKRAGYAPHIAATYGVPVPTARRWIAEARRRGVLELPADRPCRACGGSGKTRWNGATS